MLNPRAWLPSPVAASLRRGTGVAVVVGLLAASPAAAVVAPPSIGDLATQRAEAERLHEDVNSTENEVAEAQARLDELAAAAGAALEEYTLAVRAQSEAEADHWEQTERLTAARTELNSSRGELGRWAAETYRGGAARDYEALATLLEAESTDELSLRLSMLRVVGRAQGGTVRDAGDAAEAQASAVARAEETARAVAETTAAAEAAKARSDQLVAEQREQVAHLEAALHRSRVEAYAAQHRADQMAREREIAAQQKAEQLARARELVAARQVRSAPPMNLDGLNVVTGQTGECRGEDVQRYGNGQIPPSALCPLWGAPGHLLRADAAFAYHRLAEAYASDHGEALCITDSYRTYEAQVRLKAAKPRLAARPGTSNHGWGTAVDLCGGIQTFGTPQHRWMQANAPLYGFFHPRWAQQDGSKPEPWHWEFGG